MDGLFTKPEKLVLLWCPGLSGLVAEAAAVVSLGAAGCRRGAAVVSLDAAGVPPWLKRPAEVFAAHSIWDEFE